MADPSATTRLVVLLFLFRQICGVVIPVPEEMVPDNLMMRDSDSESGFSINRDVLNQLLSKVYSSSIVKRRNMVNDYAECKECCENEEEETKDDHEENTEENVHHQAENSNNHLQYPEQMTRHTYRPTYPQESVHLEDQRTQERSTIHECVERGKETLSTPYSPKVPHTVFKQQIQQAPSNSYQSTSYDYQTVSEQFPFTEFSPKAFYQPKQIKVPNSNRHFIQDSSRGMQQRYEHQQVRPSSQSNTQTSSFSGRQQILNFQSAQQETALKEEPADVDYRQYANPSCAPEQRQRKSPLRLQIDNVSVHRRTPS